MRRRVVYKALLECPSMSKGGGFVYQWYASLIDPEKTEEFKTEIQTTHMKNRLVGGYRCYPFYIEWAEMEMVQNTYEI